MVFIMDYEKGDHGNQRGVFLSILLTVLGSSLLLFFLFITCGGLIIYILAVVAGISALGLVHYFLWGHSMSEQVAKEQDEEETPPQGEVESWIREEKYPDGPL